MIHSTSRPVLITYTTLFVKFWYLNTPHLGEGGLCEHLEDIHQNYLFQMKWCPACVQDQQNSAWRNIAVFKKTKTNLYQFYVQHVKHSFDSIYRGALCCCTCCICYTKLDVAHCKPIVGSYTEKGSDRTPGSDVCRGGEHIVKIVAVQLIKNTHLKPCYSPQRTDLMWVFPISSSILINTKITPSKCFLTIYRFPRDDTKQSLTLNSKHSFKSLRHN